MSKKMKKEKDYSKSQKKTPKDADLNEYETPKGDEKKLLAEEKTEEKIHYQDYELPKDFVPPEEKQSMEKLNWWQRRNKSLIEMENYQRLYWIKILTGVIAGIILGMVGAHSGWWLFLFIGLYAIITTSGFFLFKLKWNWKEVLLSGFFPYLALFWMFWTLMFTSLYAPINWLNIIIQTKTITTSNSTYITTISGTTAAGGFPFMSIIFITLAGLTLLQILLRKYRKPLSNN